MSEQGVCLGCCLNPNWISEYKPQPTCICMCSIQPTYICTGSLTDEEKAILYKMGEVYNLFNKLDKVSTFDHTEFLDAIHKAQQLIALRVARRVDPEVWNQPKE
jgi:hypothetical protein